jgi:hypothetical protein
MLFTRCGYVFGVGAAAEDVREVLKPLGLVSQRRCSAFKAEDGASESPSRRLTSSADHGEFDRRAGRPHRTGVVALLSGIRRCRSETPNGLWPALGRFST